ncbi:hypothetical protein [Glycomyces tarimensis]
MIDNHSGPFSTRPNTVRLAQALIWLQFTAIIGLYTLGLNFVLAATTAAASDETTTEVLLHGGVERWALVATSIAVTGSLPIIAVQLGRRNESAIRAAWYALAFVPFCMYVWVAARAYMATFPDGPEFFISATAMLVVCASMPATILLCLATPSSRAWFASAHLEEELIEAEAEAEAADALELAGSATR